MSLFNRNPATMPRTVSLASSPVNVGYGYLYNNYAVNNAKGITSGGGWRIPLWSGDIVFLRDYLASYQGQKLKSCRQVNSPLGGSCETNEHPRWEYGGRNIINTNDYNFNAYPAGRRFPSGTFSYLGFQCTIWGDGTYIHNGTLYGIGFSLDNYTRYMTLQSTIFRNAGCSIRLVRTLQEWENEIYNDGDYMDDYIGNDLKSYPVVKIGMRAWMAVNLKETIYANNDAIIQITSNAAWEDNNEGGFCAYNNNHGWV